MGNQTLRHKVHSLTTQTEVSRTGKKKSITLSHRKKREWEGTFLLKLGGHLDPVIWVQTSSWPEKNNGLWGHKCGTMTARPVLILTFSSTIRTEVPWKPCGSIGCFQSNSNNSASSLSQSINPPKSKWIRMKLYRNNPDSMRTMGKGNRLSTNFRLYYS